MFAIKKISPIGLCMDLTRGGEGVSWMIKVPCLYWAKDCFLVSNETLSREGPALPHNPLLAPSTSLFYCEDSTIIRLYKIAFDLVYTSETYCQNIEHAVDAICITNKRFSKSSCKGGQECTIDESSKIVRKRSGLNNKVAETLLDEDSSSQSSQEVAIHPNHLPLASSKRTRHAMADEYIEFVKRSRRCAEVA